MGRRTKEASIAQTASLLAPSKGVLEQSFIFLRRRMIKERRDFFVFGTDMLMCTGTAYLVLVVFGKFVFIENPARVNPSFYLLWGLSFCTLLLLTALRPFSREKAAIFFREMRSASSPIAFFAEASWDLLRFTLIVLVLSIMITGGRQSSSGLLWFCAHWGVAWMLSGIGYCWSFLVPPKISSSWHVSQASFRAHSSRVSKTDTVITHYTATANR